MRRALVLSCALIAGPAAAATPALTTEAERSGFRVTGRYDEVLSLCSAFQKTYPKWVRCFTFGTTPEGRPMVALAASKSGALTPAAARARALPVLLAQGGIHAGEIDGKDAVFLLLREALEGRRAQGTLERHVLLFVPVFNIDGHERFGKWNRPNQRGPEATGWRTTGQNLNLNRDYAKAQSPEMQALLGLINAWDPLVYTDLHVTDGAKFQHDIAFIIEPVHSGDGALRAVGKSIRARLLADLSAAGSHPLPFYPSFVVDDDPASGVRDSASRPAFSHAYYATRNRIGILVETHSWRDYPARVRSTAHAVESMMRQVSENAAAWLRIAREADARASALGGTTVPITYKPTDQSRPIEFLGYEYTRSPSDVSGAVMTRYDEAKPQVWRMPLWDDVQPHVTVVAPRGGYLVPAAHAEWIAEKLRQHGISSRRLAAPLIQANVEGYRAATTAFAATPFEGRQRLTVTGAWARETRDVGKGSLFVPIAQPKARLVMALLEPEAPDSLLAWGFLNAAFEKKEAMEAYVAEEVAREMLTADPVLAETFRKRLATDATFASSPAGRLEFFHRRHASWDERYNLYPILRTDDLN